MIPYLLFIAQAAVEPTAAPATAFPKNDDSKIVCRTLIGTGSRLNTERVCLPKREWRRMWDQGRETTSKIQDNHSSRPKDFGQ